MPPGPLVVSNEPALVSELEQLADIAGTGAQVQVTTVDVRRAWAAASTVVVGLDMADQLIGLRLPRRHRVLLLAHGDQVQSSWQRAAEVGAEQILSLPADRDRLLAALRAGATDWGGGLLVSVTGGCGGAGASVFAAALATTASTPDRSVVLVDLDPWGGGADLLLGGETAQGLRWPDLAATSGRINAASLRAVLPIVDDVSVLSWARADPVPVAPSSVRTVLTAARDGHGLAVADVARGEDEVVREALSLAACTLLVLPAQIRSVAAARTRLPLLRAATTDLRLVVREVSAGGLAAEEVADALELPLVTSMRPERGLTGWLEQGLGPIRRRRGPLARACRATLTALASAGSIADTSGA